MMNMLLIELRKALTNRFFVLAILLGCVLAVISALCSMSSYGTSSFAYNEDKVGLIDLQLSLYTLYRYVMVSDWIQPSTGLYFSILPILAAMPYGWSMVQERKRGYADNVCVRVTRSRYLAAKALAAFLSGAVAIGLPLVINFVACACYIPAYPTNVDTFFQTGMYDTVMWSSAYYNDPLCYNIQYLLLNMLFAGLWGAAVVMIGGLFTNAVKLIAGAFLVVYTIGAFEFKIQYLISGLNVSTYIEFSPIYFLRGVYVNGINDFSVVLLWCAVLLVIAFAAAVYSLRRDML